MWTIRTPEPAIEVEWFAALCNEDDEYLGAMDGIYRSSFEHCAEIVTTADRLGYQYILMPSSFNVSQEPLLFAGASAGLTEQIQFLVAVRMGEIHPPMLARHLSTLDHLLKGRLTVNIISSDLPGLTEPNEVRYAQADEVVQKWAMVAAGSIVMTFSVIIGIIGMYTYQMNPHLTLPDEALPWLIVHALPSWLAAAVVVSAAAAILSCANGNASAVASFFLRHIFPLATGRYPRNPVPAARWAWACAVLLSTTIALHNSSVVDFVVKFLPVTMSGLAFIILLGRFWKRANRQGALAALVVTPLASLAVIFIPAMQTFWGYPAIPAVTAGVIAQVLVSLLTIPQKRTFGEVSEAMRQERENIEAIGPHPTIENQAASSLRHANVLLD